MLLHALQSHVEGDNADQAATAALALLVHAEHDVPDLARDPDVAALKVLRARDVRASRPVALSLKALIERSQDGLLFAASVDANRLLPSLTAALPDMGIFIVEGGTAQFLRESGGSTLLLRTAGKNSAFALINKASSFGSEDARLQLLERLRFNVEDDPAALRRLCAGHQEAGYSRAKLWVLDGVPSAIERIIAAVLNRSEGDFLVPSRIAAELTPKLQQHIGIRPLDTAAMEALLERNLDGISELHPTALERDAFLLTQLPDTLLRRLPIHVRSDGDDRQRGECVSRGRLANSRSIDDRMSSRSSLATTDRRANGRSGLLRHGRRKDKSKSRLLATDPHRFRSEILDALAKAGISAGRALA